MITILILYQNMGIIDELYLLESLYIYIKTMQKPFCCIADAGK